MLYHDMITGNKNISQENIKNIEATISKYKVNNKNIPYLKEPLYHLRPLVTRVIHYNEEQKNIWLMYFHKIIHKSKSIEKLWKEEVEEKQFPNSIDGKKLLERIKENANSQSEESERFKILFSKSMPTLFEKIDMIALFQIIAYNKDEKSTNENTRFKNLFQPIPDSPSKKNLEAIVKKKRKSVS